MGSESSTLPHSPSLLTCSNTALITLSHWSSAPWNFRQTSWSSDVGDWIWDFLHERHTDPHRCPRVNERLLQLHNTKVQKHTFTRSWAAVIFEVGTVLALVIIRTVAAEIIALVIEALGPILARVGLAIIDVQLSGMVEREERGGQNRESKSKALFIFFPRSQEGSVESDLFNLPPLFACVRQTQCSSHQPC